MQYYLKQFAANYDCAAYGTGDYNNPTCSTATDGQLVDTGTNVAVGLIGGVLLIAVAIVLLIRLRRKKHNA